MSNLLSTNGGVNSSSKIAFPDLDTMFSRRSEVIMGAFYLAFSVTGECSEGSSTNCFPSFT